MVKNGSYKPEDLSKYKAYKSVIDETDKLIQESISAGIEMDIPEAMKNSLKNDVFVFSALKTHAQLFDASRMLTKEDGTVRNFFEFQQAVETIYQDYNINYLDAERTFALTAAQQAANWVAIEANGDRYNLQYRTALDDKVRELHRVMEGITLPASDAFWLQYYPPNGWRCRCVAAEVNKDKYETTDPNKAAEAGEAATTKINAKGQNTLEIFRFNPGKEKVIFPPHHPYNKVKDANIIKEFFSRKEDGKNIDLSKFFKKSADRKAAKSIMLEWVQRNPEHLIYGLKDLKFSSAGYMMQHSIRVNRRTLERVGKSTISISTKTFQIGNGFNPSVEFINGLTAIKNGEDLTFNQEYAFEAMWHEILHGKTKSKHFNMSRHQTQVMETVNQFVARHTYPQFIESFGGKSLHQADVLDNGYGYKEWITDFRKKLKAAGIEESEAVKFLEPHLLNDYTNLNSKMNELFSNNK